jgi:hypothetical protein
MKTPNFILILCFFTIVLKAENKPLPYRVAVVEKVIKQLFNANGNYRVKMPVVEMRMTTQQVAAYIPDKNMVIIEDKAYQICQSMGADSLDALAFLLGHELTHAYQHAKTKTGFISSFLAYDKAKNADTHKENEADLQGAFNAYLAGYDIKNNIPAILEKLYVAYQLKGKTLSGYPSFEERLQVANTVQNTVNDLIQVYETANYMTAMGQYAFARLCYEHILQVYQNREIYNNLGVISALAATELSPKNGDMWLYPYEIDWQTRLSRKKSRGEEAISDDQQKERLALLSKAKSYFETAYRMDKNYSMAAVNALCVMAQMGNVEAAEKRYKSLKIKDNLQKDYAKMAYAIALCHNPLRQKEAREIFQSLENNPTKSIAHMATHNIAILDNKERDTDPKACTISFEKPIVDGVQLHKLPSAGQVISINTHKNAQLTIQKHATSTVIQAKMKNGYYFAFQRTKKAVNTEGVAVGTLIATSVGYMSLCDDLHVVFRYDTNNALVEWVSYYGN